MEEQRLEEFLSHFPNFHTKIFVDQRVEKTKISNIDINRTLDEQLEINRNNPSCLYFTPNGSIGTINQIGKKCDLSVKNITGYINAYVLDFNKIKFPNLDMDGLLKYIKDLIKKRLKIEWRYIVKTMNGYHVYFVLNHKDKENLHNTYGYKQLEIVKYLASELGADTNAKVTTNIAALFRLPYSVYWNLASKHEINIVSFQDKYVDAKQVHELMLYLEQITTLNNGIKGILKSKDGGKYREFNDRNVEEIIEAMGRGKNGEIKDNRLVGVIGEDLFSNPVGSPLEYIWLCNEGDSMKTRLYLNEECGVEKNLNQGKQINNIIGNGYEICFFENSVVLKKLGVSRKGETFETDKTIFLTGIKVLGKGYITSNKMGEGDQPRMVYIFLVNGEERVIEQICNKRGFNQSYPDIFFFGDDNDLGLFFNGLMFCDDIKEINVYERSGYYNDICLLGNKCIVGDIGNGKIMFGNNQFDIIDSNEVKDISVKEYFEIFKDCYVETFSVPLFLSAISLAGMNLWNTLEVNPALLLSGKTGCGKSTVVTLLKRMLGYGGVREMALPGITPQPLKQAASDNAILFLEELTNRVGPATEELLRNIVNRDKAARGSLDGNTFWEFRSPLRVNGERTFKDESLNNRFCSFIMTSEFWKEDALQKINELIKYTAYKDIYYTYISNKELLRDLLYKYKDMLIDKGYKARTSDVRSYIFVVNDIFNFGYSFEELTSYMDIHLSNAGQKEKRNINNTVAFERFILKAIINKKMNLILKEGKEGGVPYIYFDMLFLDEDIYQTNRGIINSAINDINNKYGNTIFSSDDGGIMGYMKNVKKDGKYTSDGDQYLYDLFTRVISSLPGSMTHYNRSFMLLDN